MLKINLLGKIKIEYLGENLESKLSNKTVAIIYLLIANKGRYLSKDKLVARNGQRRRRQKTDDPNGKHRPAACRDVGAPAARKHAAIYSRAPPARTAAQAPAL